MHRLRWRHAARTDVGRIRAHNEDAWLAVPEAGAFAVADGLGGHAGGEVASELAVRLLADALGASGPDRSPRDARETLLAGLRAANRAIREEAYRDPSLRGMGTTVTALLLADDEAFVIGHVGDSRAYRLRDGSLERLTRDHTVVQQLVDRGRLTDEQARLHPRSSVLTRALGIEREVETELYDGRVRAGDRFLLCSDGLTAMLPEDRVRQLLEEAGEPTAVAERLVAAANEAGGADNITVLVLDVLATD